MCSCGAKQQWQIIQPQTYIKNINFIPCSASSAPYWQESEAECVTFTICNPYQVPKVFPEFHSVSPGDDYGHNGKEAKSFLSEVLFPPTIVCLSVCVHFRCAISKGVELSCSCGAQLTFHQWCVKVWSDCLLVRGVRMNASVCGVHWLSEISSGSSVYLWFQQERRPVQQKYWLCTSQRLSSISLL